MNVSQPRMIYQSQRQFSLSNTFAKKAAGSTKLKQFFKYTHPDFFGGASEAIKETNLRSV